MTREGSDRVNFPGVSIHRGFWFSVTSAGLLPASTRHSPDAGGAGLQVSCLLTRLLLPLPVLSCAHPQPRHNFRNLIDLGCILGPVPVGVGPKWRQTFLSSALWIEILCFPQGPASERPLYEHNFLHTCLFVGLHHTAPPAWVTSQD